ncbi:hypothetical protein SCLCIDRAFT_825866 [Scleroderma citrinum Foug A]|uniref:Uncharacterized protein n=1 Tax=Scleroderma citrinum Foug A TaxID=1036808 RepID=A0A0C3EMY6_9AGAM|nr:hypothetical protein SCLCIDRAFT_825866 [Scleroderma citrinum Foug A]
MCHQSTIQPTITVNIYLHAYSSRHTALSQGTLQRNLAMEPRTMHGQNVRRSRPQLTG